MSHAVPPPAARPVAALASAVLVLGLCASVTLSPPERPTAVTAAAAAAAAPVPAPPPAPAAPVTVSLPLEPAPPAALAPDPGDAATWSTRRLAAQLVFACVQTSDLATAASHAAAGVGGIALLGRPSDGAALTAALAAVRAAGPEGVAPLVASDEEGGRVQRLRDVLGRLPSAAEMGGWPDAQIEQTAHDYGVGMRGLGVQLALSPVADLGVPGHYVFDTGRGFSADAGRVAGAAAAWTRGLQRAGVVATVKHWPGHGYAADSHTEAPVGPPLPHLEQRDLLPFDAVLAAGAGVVMVGHLRSEGLTEPGVPATLSPNALRVLRERVGPSTVVLTDSLSMAASSSALGLRPADAAVRALQAGADWAMVCVDPISAVDAVQAALDTGAWSREAAVAAVRRVLALKQRVGLVGVPLATAAPAGALEGASITSGVVRLVGHAADAETPAPVTLRVLVEGAPVLELPAGPDARFVADLPVPPGKQVCVQALNTGPGPSAALGCVTTPV